MENLGKLDPQFWKGKQVLLTGHTGFKGAWMLLLLNNLGAQVSACSLAPQTNPNLFVLLQNNFNIKSIFLDIRELESLQNFVKTIQPEIVIHMAAQALVLPSYSQPLGTFSTNIIGTANLLDSLRSQSQCRVFINVTSDKCYENPETGKSFKETDPLGGFDPYSASKAGAEIVAQSYYRSFLKDQNKGLGSVRAGNVIGGGDWSEYRLIPDIIRAQMYRGPFKVRHPQAIRPWQHVLEPLGGYLVLAQNLWKNPAAFSGAWNFGPSPLHQCTVANLIDKSKNYLKNYPEILIEKDQSHEAHLLTLDSTKAQFHLHWKPRWNLDQTLRNTFEWYSQFLEGKDPFSLCQSNISEYFYELQN